MLVILTPANFHHNGMSSHVKIGRVEIEDYVRTK